MSAPGSDSVKLVRRLGRPEHWLQKQIVIAVWTLCKQFEWHIEPVHQPKAKRWKEDIPKG